uniref:Uncharacterized protein n=1 Tax=Anguilla anguilla TaxID=7936 RepID=A0A0E9SG40_ANGAN
MSAGDLEIFLIMREKIRKEREGGEKEEDKKIRTAYLAEIHST